MITEPLTDRQQQVLDTIIDHARTERRMPTVRELQRTLNVSSTNGIMCHLKALAKKGFIERERNSSRSIRLVTEGVCPCCGK